MYSTVMGLIIDHLVSVKWVGNKVVSRRLSLLSFHFYNSHSSGIGIFPFFMPFFVLIGYFIIMVQILKTYILTNKRRFIFLTILPASVFFCFVKYQNTHYFMCRFSFLIGHLIFWHIYKNRVYTYGKKRLILPFYDSTFFFSKISKTIIRTGTHI